MGNKPVKLKVFIDEKQEKVVFAEAEEDFVDILFSFFTLPLGTIARLSTKYKDSYNIKLGSLTCLYESVWRLDVRHFSSRLCKSVLVFPKSSSSDLCKKLKLNLSEFDAFGNPDYSSNPNRIYVNALLVKNKGSFIITDDLNITPFLIDRHIQLHNTFGAEFVDLVKRTIYFGPREFFSLLKLALYTNNPLTNLVFRAQSKPCLYSRSLFIKNTISSNPSPKPQMVKLLVQKSKKKVLCAQVDNFFVEMLFSFLTIPLGAVKRLTDDNTSSSVGIDNLYNSIPSLVKSDDIKTMLLDPKVELGYHRVTDYLPIYNENSRRDVTFLQHKASFLVSDDLKITVSSVSNTSKFTFGIPVDDLEVIEVSIGEQEALLILKASLISTSALTDFFNTFL